MKSLSIFLTVSLGLTAFIGDYIVFKSRYSESLTYRAFSDNFIHSSIGFLSAAIFFQNVDVTKEAWIYNVVFCTMVSSLIDIDHFIMAKSIYLKDLSNLKQRGFLHCTSLWLVVAFLMILYSYLFRKLNICILSFMIIIGFSSHHIRDGNRRGIWLYPFGSTPPLPKYLYIALIVILPSLLAYLFQYIKPLSKTSVVNYSLLV